MKTNATPIHRTGLLGWLLLALVVGLAALPLLVNAADADPATLYASGTTSFASTVSYSGGVAVSPPAGGAVTITGLPPAWEAVWLKILSIAGTVVLVARVIVKITPTPKDDSVLDSVIGFLKHLGLSTPPDKPAAP
jgi:hypothetical protein